MSTLKVDGIRSNSATSDAITLASDGTVNANLTNFGRRNHVINGNFCISQRNGTTAYTGNDYGGPDRWRVNQSGATTSFQQVAFTMGEQREGSKYYAKFTSNGNDFCWIETRIEDVTKFHSQQITISFDAKYVTAKPDGGFNARLVQDYGTGGSPSNADTVYWGGSNSSESFVPTTSWQRFQWNLTTGSISGKTLGTNSNTSFLAFIVGQGSNAGGTDWELNIANVQIEYGAVASAFEQPRSMGDELALCQRYFYLHADPSEGVTSGSPNEVVIGQGFYYGNPDNFTTVHFPVRMRSTPTLIQNTGTNYYVKYRNNGADYSDSVGILSRQQSNCCTLYDSGASGSAGQASFLSTYNASARVSFNAEL